MKKREFIFRAWEKRTGQMFFSNKEYTVWAGGKSISVNCDKGQVSGDFIGMQFTELKDRNGKEIFEGDIVRGLLVYPEGTNGTLQTMGVVEYCEGFAAFSLRNESGQTLFENHIISSFEIIGNIHENPELWKQE